jgi:hypothetical protein
LTKVQDDKKQSVKSKTSKKAEVIRLTSPEGFVAEFGGHPGVEIMSPQLIVRRKKGKPTIVQSPAIKYWEDTMKAVSILLTGESKEGGYLFENIISSLSLATICTGFEVYCKRRFLELCEVIKPNYDELKKELFSDRQLKSGMFEKYVQYSKKKGHSVAFELVKRKIDFGNYQQCKNAYSKGFGINLTKDLGVPIPKIQQVIQFIEYRHKLIHVSLLENTFNYYKPEKTPVRAEKATIKQAIVVFDMLIQALHKKTKELLPT